MSDRRQSDRRQRPLIPEPLERRKDRRAEERRDAPRKRSPVALVASGSRSLGTGLLGLGGATVTTPRPPKSDAVELRAWLQGEREELVTKAKVLQRTSDGKRTTLRLVFVEPEVKAELLLARWLEGRVG
jgi:hypothetical protein